MPNKKISALTSAESALATLRIPIVSGSTNKQVTLGTLVQYFQGVTVSASAVNVNRNVTVGTGDKGYALLYVETTVAASATTAVMSGANITLTQLTYKVLTPSSGATGGTQMLLGVAADQQRFVGANFGSSISSGAGIYYPGASAVAMQNFSGTINAVFPTATANSKFIVGICYFQN